MRKKNALERERRKLIRVADLDNEVWKNVVGFEGLYLVSSFGRIKSLCRTTTYKDSNAYDRVISEKILKMKLANTGYVEVMLSINGSRNYKRVHRLVAEAFWANPENKTQVNHKDGDKKNNFYKNLEWATNSENQLHSARVLGKKTPKGESHSNAKLSTKQVGEVRELSNSGKYSCSQLGRRFNVSAALICLIKNNKIRKYDA